MRHSSEQHQDQDDNDRILATLLWNILNKIDYLSLSDNIHVTPAQIVTYLEQAVELGYLVYTCDGASSVTKKGTDFITAQLKHSGKWPRPQRRFQCKPISLDKVVFPKYDKTLKAALERSEERK